MARSFMHVVSWRHCFLSCSKLYRSIVIKQPKYSILARLERTSSNRRIVASHCTLSSNHTHAANLQNMCGLSLSIGFFEDSILLGVTFLGSSGTDGKNLDITGLFEGSSKEKSVMTTFCWYLCVILCVDLASLFSNLTPKIRKIQAITMDFPKAV